MKLTMVIWHILMVVVIASPIQMFAQCTDCYLEVSQKGSCSDELTVLEAKTNARFEGWFDTTGTRIDTSKILRVKNLTTARYLAKAAFADPAPWLHETFEQGNTGFESDYVYYSGPDNKNSFYVIDTNPHKYINAYVEKHDLTTGKGNMLIADGNTDNTKAVYRKSIVVNKHKEYHLSFWVSNIHEEFAKTEPDTTKQSLPVIQIFTDKKRIFSYRLPADTLWHRLDIHWTSLITGETELEIHTGSESVKGNDFALDEIKVTSLETLTKAIRTEACNTEPYISPDGDGIYDTYYIAEKGKAKVIDLNGNIINELSAPASWDGTKTNGVYADAGYYAILVNDKVYRVSVVR